MRASRAASSLWPCYYLRRPRNRANRCALRTVGAADSASRVSLSGASFCELPAGLRGESAKNSPVRSLPFAVRSPQPSRSLVRRRANKDRRTRIGQSRTRTELFARKTFTSPEHRNEDVLLSCVSISLGIDNQSRVDRGNFHSSSSCDRRRSISARSERKINASERRQKSGRREN